MSSLYDRADIYDLMDTPHKYEMIKQHWTKILEGKKVQTLLDVSIGTGQLTLPLLDLDITLYGSDLSPKMLEKCKEKMEKKGRSIDLRQCDFRSLTNRFTEKFDCVASTGNSLPYVSNDEILTVLEQMDKLIVNGGYLYYDIRNWDKILREKKRFFLYNPTFIDDTRVNLIQVWDYNDECSMTFNLLYTFEKNNQIFQKEWFAEHYYPVTKELLLSKLQNMGYGEIQFFAHPAQLDTEDLDNVDWYTVIARKG